MKSAKEVLRELIIELSRFRKEEESGIDLDDSLLRKYVRY